MVINTDFPYVHETAAAVVRTMVGLLFLFQGYDKLFNVGIKGVYNTFRQPMQQHHMPGWLMYAGAIFTSVIEFFGAVFLLLGLFTQWVTVALLADLMMVSVAFGIMEPVWDTRHVFPRLLLLLLILVIPSAVDVFSLNYIWFK